MAGQLRGYVRQSQNEVNVQVAAITAIDLENQSATGFTRNRIEVSIDIRHHVGAMKVIPALGEQWYIEKFQGTFRLKSKIPFNTGVDPIAPTQGQVSVGASGPLELNGSQINMNSPLRVSCHTTSSRPSASSIGMGGHIFDSVLKKPIWSDGTNWVDSAGEIV